MAQGDPDNVVLQRLAALERDARKHDHAIFGNGRPGLIQDVAEMRAAVMSIKQTAELMHQEALEQRGLQLRHAQDMGRLMEKMKGALISMEKLEKLITPIIDWKKGIIIRISTMALTVSAIGALVIGIIDHWSFIKAIFK